MKKRNKKSLCWLLLIILWPLNMAFAEEGKDYGGGGAVGFYGEYEFAEDQPETEPEKLPEVPTVSGKPNVLPKTGEKTDGVLLSSVSGVSIVSIAIYCLYREKKEKEI